MLSDVLFYGYILLFVYISIAIFHLDAGLYLFVSNDYFVYGVGDRIGHVPFSLR